MSATDDPRCGARPSAGPEYCGCGSPACSATREASDYIKQQGDLVHSLREQLEARDREIAQLRREMPSAWQGMHRELCTRLGVPDPHTSSHTLALAAIRKLEMRVADLGAEAAAMRDRVNDAARECTRLTNQRDEWRSCHRELAEKLGATSRGRDQQDSLDAIDRLLAVEQQRDASIADARAEVERVRAGCRAQLVEVIAERNRASAEVAARNEQILEFQRQILDRAERGVEARVVHPAPVPMLLMCPGCGARHHDEGDFATRPHHTHACQECGMCWRPAIVPTVGVRFLPGFGPPEVAS